MGNNIISEDEYIYYIGKELGLSDKIAFYSCMDIETYEEINKDVDEDFIKKSLKNAREKIIYSNVKKIMINSGKLNKINLFHRAAGGGISSSFFVFNIL